MEVQRQDTDGIPMLWAPGPGPSVGCLVFRVGQNDETQEVRGFTRLIEHLALAEIDVDHSYNGATGPATTSFRARGSSEEVSVFLSSVVRSLASLPWDRTQAEAAELKAEATSRAHSPLIRAAHLMLGSSHLGLGLLPELGLDAPDVDYLDRWRSHFFTRQNCALWFSGPEPMPVDLGPLPDGERRAAPEPQPLYASMPRIEFVDQSGVSGVSLASKSIPMTVASHIARHRLTNRMLGELSMANGSTVDTVWTSAKTGFVTLGSDCANEQAAEVFAESTTELARLAYDGNTPEELENYLDQERSAHDDPAAAPGVAARLCEDVLFDRPLVPPAQYLEKAASVTPTEVGAATEELLLSMLWMVPAGTSIRDQRYRAASEPGLEGRVDTPSTSPEPSQIGALL